MRYQNSYVDGAVEAYAWAGAVGPLAWIIVHGATASWWVIGIWAAAAVGCALVGSRYRTRRLKIMAAIRAAHDAWEKNSK